MHMKETRWGGEARVGGVSRLETNGGSQIAKRKKKKIGDTPSRKKKSSTLKERRGPQSECVGGGDGKKEERGLPRKALTGASTWSIGGRPEKVGYEKNGISHAEGDPEKRKKGTGTGCRFPYYSGSPQAKTVLEDGLKRVPVGKKSGTS